MPSSFSPNLRYQGQTHQVQPGETVLRALQRAGVEVASGCGQGLCLTCCLRVEKGRVPAAAQAGLDEEARRQGHFLPCLCHPEEDLVIGPIAWRPAAAQSGQILAIEPLASRIRRVIVRLSRPMSFLPGQYVGLRREDGLMRAYSLANWQSAEEGQAGDLLEFHVQLLPQGQMGAWLEGPGRVGSPVEIEGPYGAAIYRPGEADEQSRPLLLIGTGSGLAPLWSIANAALLSGHCGDIYLYHGSRRADGLYLQGELAALAARYPQFHYVPCLSGEGENLPPDGLAGRAERQALTCHPDLKDWRVFLCGHPAMVSSAKRLAYLAGARLDHIAADPFETAPFEGAGGPITQ